MAERLSAAVRDLHVEPEQRLLALVARQLDGGSRLRGGRSPNCAKPSRYGGRHRASSTPSARPLEVFSAVTGTYDVGARVGLGARSDFDVRRNAESTPGTRAVHRIGAEGVELVTEAHRGIVRCAEDGYRQVITESLATPLHGVSTRGQATQAAMSRFTDWGLWSFVGRRGRSWQMMSYAEMVVRTAIGSAGARRPRGQLDLVTLMP
ncbi:phage minor capsid protein [Streptomyces microflavus]|uniref:phage minor capsid protein n=1 Tax=Streptomyces microflavus TaxID=1919 RepID=UPI002256FA4C|nr:phage minor capsid protein [Streptomyces microflavus]MCX4653896.1 phage minor capsid protein [Streptomyces microflavus]